MIDQDYIHAVIFFKRNFFFALIVCTPGQVEVNLILQTSSRSNRQKNPPLFLKKKLLPYEM